jgi:hypothetical protein
MLCGTSFIINSRTSTGVWRRCGTSTLSSAYASTNSVTSTFSGTNTVTSTTSTFSSTTPW